MPNTNAKSVLRETFARLKQARARTPIQSVLNPQDVDGSAHRGFRLSLRDKERGERRAENPSGARGAQEIATPRADARQRAMKGAE
jgi:hypothetical protein